MNAPTESHIQYSLDRFHTAITSTTSAPISGSTTLRTSKLLHHQSTIEGHGRETMRGLAAKERLTARRGIHSPHQN